MTAPQPRRAARHRRDPTRTTAAITTLAPAVALWLALTAPQVSPVPPAPAPTVTSIVATTVRPTAPPRNHGAPSSTPRALAITRRRPIAPETVLGVVGIGAVLVSFWPLLLALRGPRPLQVAATIAHLSGMLAGYGVVILIGLMSRAAGLERGVRADRLARWHGRGGRAIVLLLIIHALAAVQAWADGRHERVWLAI
jgi:hypothetical protein